MLTGGSEMNRPIFYCFTISRSSGQSVKAFSPISAASGSVTLFSIAHIWKALVPNFFSAGPKETSFRLAQARKAKSSTVSTDSGIVTSSPKGFRRQRFM